MTMDKKLLSPNVFNTTAKRNRPLSSFLDTPTDNVSDYLQEQQRTDFIFEDFDLNVDEDELEATPINTRKNKMVISSPISRKPFKNISNLMNFDSVKRKFSSKNFLKRTNRDKQDKDCDEYDTINDSHDTNDTTNDHDNKSMFDINNEDELNANDTVSTIEDLDLNDYETSKQPEFYHGKESVQGLEQEHEPESKDDIGDMKFKQHKNPMKSLRRFHSMYQTNKEKDVILQDNSLLRHSNIKTFSLGDDSIHRIDHKSFYKLINGQYNHSFDEIVVVDCRFGYEYEGGHIKNAINISTKQELEDKFINNKSFTSSKKLIIFHCEFSVFRGPTMASHLRKSDRILNLNNYPNLTYPDILVLDGGYKKFFENYKSSCEPQNYVEMKDTNHSKKCTNELERFRSFSKSNEHNRSNSYSTITLHAENLKILKRHRSINNLKLTRSSTFSGGDDVPNLKSIYTDFQNPMTDFQPPFANFSRPNGSSNSLNSVASSNNSLSLTELSTCSSNESTESFQSATFNSPAFYPFPSFPGSSPSKSRSNSVSNSLAASSVSISNSPIQEMNEFFSSSPSTSSLTLNLSKYRKKSVTKGNVSNLSLDMNSTSSVSTSNSFKFPNGSPRRSKPIREPLKETGTVTTQTISHPHRKNSSISTKINHFPNPSITSPTISSPLSSITPLPTPMSTIDTSISHRRHGSIIDPINDTPVDFQVPYKKQNNSQFLDL